MDNLLRTFDRFSFWLGFLAASLFWFLFLRLRPVMRRFMESLKLRSDANSQERSQSDEIRLGNDTLCYAQRWHLAASLFSLDEVLVPPRLLAPAVPPAVYELSSNEDITDQAIPNTPDWPEFASYYGAPWLTLLEALQCGANVAITGQPGSGKTVALATLASQVIRKDPQVGVLEPYTPVLVHAADLTLPPPNPQDPLSSLQAALSTYVTSIPSKRFPQTIQNLFKQGHALLIMDGLDELDRESLAITTAYLQDLFLRYPKLRAVVAADPYNLGKLRQLDFIPLSLATWGSPQRAIFISRWSELWNRFISNRSQNAATGADPLLIIGWLLNNTEFLTPMELTLKVWAAFAGDALGAAPLASLEAHLRRLLATQPDKNRQALEQLAAEMILNMRPVVDRKTADAWLSGESTGAEAGPTTECPPEVEQKTGPVRIRAAGALAQLLESGILVEHVGERVCFANPSLAGYLAAQMVAVRCAGARVAQQPEWVGKSTTLNYLSILDSQADWLGDLIQEEDIDVLLRGLFSAARWMRIAPEGLPWIPGVMRRLVLCLQNDTLPLALKTRVVSALVLSGNNSIPVLLRQMVAAPRPDLRQLAVLGLGALRDSKSVNEVIQLLDDPNLGVTRAALLSLVMTGAKHGLEAVAGQLMQGDESQRRAAAEALANHPEEGYPTLKDGSGVMEDVKVEDAGVRRAVAFGLGRTRQAWAIDILEKMRAHDKQWMVQDAANQVLENLTGANPRIPRPLPPLNQTPWLMSFAAERGMAVAPGKPAYQLLFKALDEGTEDQCIAAMYYLSQKEDEGAVVPLYQMYLANRGELRERAWETLWSLSEAGIPLPPPVQFGLR